MGYRVEVGGFGRILDLGDCMIEQYIIGGIGTLIVGMCGAIWTRVGRLDEKFDTFQNNCRERHENVVTKDEWVREHAKLEAAISAAHRRFDEVISKTGT